MARNYFILFISFLGAVALADYAIVSGLVNFQTSIENPQNPDSSVIYKLAQKYEAGIEVELDMDKAIYWYQVAAKNGSKEAKNRLLALNIPLNTRSKDSQGNNKSRDNEIDQEAQKITKLLEKQLAREAGKDIKPKQNKTQENAQDLQFRLAKEKKEAQQILQLKDAKLKETPNSQTDSDRDNELATFKPSTNKDVRGTTDTITRKTVPVPLALQPDRPLNLPSTQKASTSTSNSELSEQLTAYDEDTDTENDNNEFTENENSSAKKEDSQGEKKEFNVNPCNGLVAKFMSTCR